jgi:ribosomal protein S18 acetylase RimI-like enzyme
MLLIKQAISKKHIVLVHNLFLEYADYLGIDLEFQDFKNELNNLPGEYSQPRGCLLLAFFNSELAGCVALRKIDKVTCEMKRLYVRQAFRGKGIAKALSKKVIESARKIGYKYLRLDTLPSMKEAINLYLSLGFKEIAAYRYNPIEDAKFFELNLTNRSESI